MLLLAAACCRSSTFVCTGQRLVRARVVLSSTPGFASMNLFQINNWKTLPVSTTDWMVETQLCKLRDASNTFVSIFPSDIVTAYFSSRLLSFCQACFSSTRANPGFVWNKKKRQQVWYTRVIRVHIDIYSTYIWWYNYNITAVLLHVVGTQEVAIQYTAVRVHVPGTYCIIHTSQQQTATTVVVLQLLSLAAAACFTLYTALYNWYIIVVCRYCWT